MTTSYISNAAAIDRVTTGALQELLQLEGPGRYRLPDDLHAVLQALDGVRARLAEARKDLWGYEIGERAGELASQVASAALAGANLDEFEVRIAEAEVARRRAEARVATLEVAEEQIRRMVRIDVELIVHACLQPSFDEVLEDAQDAAAILGDRDLGDAGSFLEAEPKIRNAYVLLRSAADRYDVLRQALAAAHRLDPVKVDKAGYFRELRDPEGVGAPISGTGVKPWPEERLARLVWMATVAEGNVWLPSAAQQDERASEWIAKRDAENPRRWTAVGL